MIGWYADLPDQADEALAIARKLDNPALLMRALAACGLIGLALRRRTSTAPRRLAWPGD